MTTQISSGRVKACCAAGYSSDAVAMLLGPSYHPGGLTLTRRLLHAVALSAGERLVDVASGLGTTALLATEEYGAWVDGLELAAGNVAQATAAAAGAGLGDRVQFHVGDAESLPFDDASADVVVCECALCTFPDKPTAASEIARVLRTGGRLGLTDVTADRNQLPDELTGLTAWVACVADARTAEEYRTILMRAGLTVLTIEPQTQVLRRLVDQIEARLELLRMTGRRAAEAVGIDFTRTAPVLSAVRAAIQDGTLDYVLITAEKP